MDATASGSYFSSFGGRARGPRSHSDKNPAIADIHRINLVKHVLQAHAYWKVKGLELDLVILNEDFSGYRQELHERMVSLIAGGTQAHRVDLPGGI